MGLPSKNPPGFLCVYPVASTPLIINF